MFTPCLIALAVTCVSPPAMIRITAGDGGVTVVTALPEAIAATLPSGRLEQARGEAILRVTLLDENNLPGPALLGTYTREGAQLRFTPRFELASGQRYRALLFHEGKLAFEIDYIVPSPKLEASPQIEAIFPSTDEVPANLLKFYIHFSKPMREGPALFDRIHILDDKGKPVEDPWRRTELWNAEANRLTLWIHPGRIKQGVNLNGEFGPVLQPERKYTLVLSADLLDSEGHKLGNAVTKSFRTTAPIREAMDLQQWKLDPPRAGTRQPLELTFPQPLDRLLLTTSLKIYDHQGKAITGVATLGKKERSWAFVPSQIWGASAYTLDVSDRLEDLAGNTPLRAFDHDLQRAPSMSRILTRRFLPIK